MLPFDGRRSSIQIVSDTLRLLRLGDAGKTEIMYTVKLSYYQTQRYLSWLSDINLIHQSARENRSPSYAITGKGLELLREIEAVQEMLHVRDLRDIPAAPRMAVRDGLGRRILKRLGDTLRDR